MYFKLCLNIMTFICYHLKYPVSLATYPSKTDSLGTNPVQHLLIINNYIFTILKELYDQHSQSLIFHKCDTHN